MKLTNNIAKMTIPSIVFLLTVIGCGSVLSQTRSLKHGVIVVNGTTYDVRIMDGHDDIYVHNDSAYDKKRALFNHEAGATIIPEHFIEINTKKLLEIKRKFYPSTFSRVRVTAILTKDGKLIGMEYALPKSPAITERQFRTLDSEIRRHLKISIVFPTERVKNQKYDGYTTKTVLLY